METPARLHRQLCLGRFDISRQTALADMHCFGFAGQAEAASYLDALLGRITAGFDRIAHWLDPESRQALHERLTHNVAVLMGGDTPTDKQ